MTRKDLAPGDIVPRVALYARVSTQEQARHGLSIDAQMAALREWAKREGVIVAGEYVDAGVSARKPAAKRPMLCKLLEAVERDEIDLIVFCKLDRWFRNVQQYYKVQEVLDAHRVAWKAINEDYETQTASGRLKVNIMLSVAQDEADRTAERIRFVLEDKKRRGQITNGRVGIGFVRTEEKKLGIDPDTVEIARDIADAYIRLKSISALRKYMLDKHGILRSYTQWRRLLSNERYIGIVDGKQMCEPIWSREDFDLIQRMLAANSAPDNHTGEQYTYLFTGMVYCADCGHRLVTHVAKKVYHYYRCPNYKLGTCGHKTRTRDDILERYMLDHLLTGIEIHNIEQRMAKKKAPADAEAVSRKMERLKELYVDGLISRERFDTQYSALAEQIAYVPPGEEAREIDIEQYRDALSTYDTLPRDLKREFWGRIVERIDIGADGEIFFKLSL